MRSRLAAAGGAAGRAGVAGNLCGCAGGDDPSAGLPAAQPHVDDPVDVGDHVEVMFDDVHGGPGLHEPVPDPEQDAHAQRMQADAGLVEHEHGPVLVASQVRGELEALRRSSSMTPE